MSRFKLFVTNFLVYGLGGMISKIVPLIMLPIVTRLMPDSAYFGLNDLSTIVVSFGSAIAVLGMYDAMFRMFFEKDDEEYKKDICSTTLVFTLITSFVVFAFLVIFQKPLSGLFFGSYTYSYLLIISALNILFGATNNIVSAPTRMENRKKVFLVTNTLSPVISYSIAIPLLINKQYTIALPLAATIASVTLLCIFIFLNRKWFKLRKFNTNLLKQMLVIALPLMPNFLVYWVFNSSDRLMINAMLGAAFTGVYAIGAKVGQISNLIYTAFAGGWQFFAFSTMKDDDQVEMTSNVFEYLGIISFIAGIGMMIINRFVFTVVFVGEYSQGATVAPYLFVAPLFLMLYQTICNQFIVIKKTWPNIIILSFSALLNVGINYVLIPIIGIEGAALGTLAGYITAVLLCVIVLTHMKLINIKKRFFISFAIFAAYMLVWRFFGQNNTALCAVTSIPAIAAYVILYKQDVTKLIKSATDKGDRNETQAV